MRLIDADALKETIVTNVYPVMDYFNSRDYGMFWTGGIEKAIDEQPTIEPKRNKGRWVNKKPRWIGSLSMTIQDAYECSNCGEAGVNWWKHCTYCGSPMEIEEWRKPIIERWRNENKRSNR